MASSSATSSDIASYRTTSRVGDVESALEQGGGVGSSSWVGGFSSSWVRSLNYLALTSGLVGCVGVWGTLVSAASNTRRSSRMVGLLPQGGQRSRSNASSTRLLTSCGRQLAAVGISSASVGVAQGKYIAGQKSKKAMRPNAGKGKLPTSSTKSGVTVSSSDSKKSIWS